MNKKLVLTKQDDESDDDGAMSEKYLGYAERNRVNSCISVPIDEGVQPPSYYRQVVQRINTLGEGDRIEFEINSPGGYLSGLLSLLTAIVRTDATTVAFINGNCHSAASILSMHCDMCYVSPYAVMLVHFISFGAAGKGADVALQTNFSLKQAEQLFRESYTYFLTEAEIKKCISGYELWLDAEEIQKRMQRRMQGLQKELKQYQKAQKKTKKEPDIKIPDTFEELMSDLE